MPSPTAPSWVKFFTNADIPSQAAATYAHVFVENRIQMDMLMDLNKEYLREMGITTMGDIIAILRHAKKVAEQNAREKVLSVPENEPGVPVATVSGTPSTGTVSNAKKTDRPGVSRTVSSTGVTSKESKPRRVLPEHEGKYKIILPTGSTVRSREILQKKEARTAPSVEEKPPARAGVKRGSIFDRLSNDNEPSANFTSKVQKVEPPMSLTISSSIFSRLGDRTVSINRKEDVGATSAGILKKSSGTMPSVAPDVKYNPSAQKVILVKKIPAKAATVSSDEEDLDNYPRVAGFSGLDASIGGGLKSVSFSEEDEVLEIAPRVVRIEGQSGGSPGARRRFSEDAVSVKQRLGGGGVAGAGGAGVNRSVSLHGTKKVVQMKQPPTSGSGAGSKLPPARSSLKSDDMLHARKQPIKNRLSLGTRTETKSLSTRVERFSLDSKMAKVGKGSAKTNGSVFDRLGYNRK